MRLLVYARAVTGVYQHQDPLGDELGVEIMFQFVHREGRFFHIDDFCIVKKKIEISGRKRIRGTVPGDKNEDKVVWPCPLCGFVKRRAESDKRCVLIDHQPDVGRRKTAAFGCPQKIRHRPGVIVGIIQTP